MIARFAFLLAAVMRTVGPLYAQSSGSSSISMSSTDSTGTSTAPSTTSPGTSPTQTVPSTQPPAYAPATVGQGTTADPVIPQDRTTHPNPQDLLRDAPVEWSRQHAMLGLSS